MKLRRKIINEFLKESSIHGLQIFTIYSPIRYAKKIWFIFMVMLIIWTHYQILNLIIEFLEQPTELHMSTKLVHVSNSPFPTVAICSANMISKRKLVQYAEKIFRDQETFQPGLLAKTSEEMAQHLLLLIGLYGHIFDDYFLNDVRLERLHQILTFSYNTTEYPSREILRNLAPDCENLIIRGMVFGKLINTSGLFVKRVTSYSTCCLFNNLRGSFSQDPKVKLTVDNSLASTLKVRFESNSILNNIQFVLQNDLDDFTVTQYSTDAFQFYLTPPYEYATIQSSSVGEIFIDHDKIVEIPVQPNFFESSYAIHQFSPAIRRCYFPDEGQKLLNQSYYSLDDCLLICRMKSMIKYCGCVNPSLPVSLLNATVCNLLHLPCLTQWKRHWYRRNYFSYVNDNDDEHNNDGKIHSSVFEGCDNCLPSCDGVNFDINVDELPLRKTSQETYSFGLLKGLSNAKPLAIVKLFFKRRYAQSTIANIVGDWVVLLNRFGGIMGLMYGFGIISYIELLYYCTGKWFTYKLFTRSSSTSSRNVKINSQEYSLYWNELQPHKR